MPGILGKKTEVTKQKGHGEIGKHHNAAVWISSFRGRYIVEKVFLGVRGRVQARRQAAIIHPELQVVRTLLYGYAIQDIDLPLLVVRIRPCRQTTVIESKREYLKNEIPILGCKR